MCLFGVSTVHAQSSDSKIVDMPASAFHSPETFFRYFREMGLDKKYNEFYVNLLELPDYQVMEVISKIRDGEYKLVKAETSKSKVHNSSSVAF